MPCSECGHLLYVDYDNQELRCPQCKGLPLEDDDILQRKIQEGKDLFSEENQIQLLQEYSKEHLLLYLISRLNYLGKTFYDTRGFSVREFSYLNYLIKNIYQCDDFGDGFLETGFDEIAAEIDALLDAQGELINALNHAEEGFRFCVPWPVEMPNAKTFFGEYWFRDSEYRLCYHRCLRSLMGGTEDDKEIYDWTAEIIRDFDRPAADEIDSLRDFADCFYEIIASLKFVAAANETVGDIYTTFPTGATVFDLKDFLDCLDTQFGDREHAAMRRKGITAAPSEALVDTCGERTFGDNWGILKDQLIIGENNLGAHPFLFRIEHEEVLKKVPGRDPITTMREKIIYPKFYDLIVRLQLFPLLRNGSDQSTGHELLSEITAKRGKQFERNIHEYLLARGYESYHSAELSKNNPTEIDVIAVSDNEIWFIECKYLMPEINMNSAKGIKRVNETFDHKVFKLEGGYEHAPTGDPFDEKIERWLNVEGGVEFRTQVGPDEDDIEMRDFKPEWLDLEPQMMVVSNIVPSYATKRNVKFLTDVEFVELLEGWFEPFEVIH
jgi:Holliday junction resolvase-like predicted endonuclease